MKKIFVGIAVFFLFLSYYLFVPETVCSVDWVDSARKPIQGKFYECKRKLETRHVGLFDYIQIDNDVYRVSEIYHQQLPSHTLRSRVEKNFLLIRLDGPVDLDKLQSYFSDRYLSDNKVILDNEGRRVLSLSPTLNIANLRPVPNLPANSDRVSDYATDGRWVILRDKVVENADATTFKQVSALELDGSQVESHTNMEFARDQRAVYHGGDKLDDADPESFGIISYNDCRNPPPGIDFFSQDVELGAGWVALDRTHAWEVTSLYFKPLPVTAAQLKMLNSDLKKATIAAQKSDRPQFEDRMCKR
jgi:hypothetical protein